MRGEVLPMVCASERIERRRNSNDMALMVSGVRLVDTGRTELCDGLSISISPMRPLRVCSCEAKSL